MVGAEVLVGQAEHLVDHPVVRDAEAERQPALAHGLHRQRLLGQGDRVARLHRHHRGADLDAAGLGGRRCVAAVRASNSSGIWGTHTDARPASSAHRASACMRSTLVR